MTPKEKFLTKLINIVMDFEIETGVEFKDIHFKRINVSEISRLSEKTLITEIGLGMR